MLPRSPGLGPATVLDDGSRRVLVAGGYRIDDPAAAAELYAPADGGTWSTASSMVEAHYAHSATLLSDGRVLVAGGAVLVPDGLPNGEHTALAEVYDPATGAQTGTLTGKVTAASQAGWGFLLFVFYSHPNFARKSSVDWTSPKVTRNFPRV